MSELNLKVGKKYLNRNGTVVEIVHRTESDALGFCFIGVSHQNGTTIDNAFRPGGQYLKDMDGESSNDLIAEYHEWHDFKIDDPIMVRKREDGNWLPRYFAGVHEGMPHAWYNGATSWTAKHSLPWLQCRRPTKEELDSKRNHRKEIK